jgi:hypothetical protein
LHINVSKLGEVDLSPRNVVWTGDLSRDRALNRVSEPVIELFGKGWELEIMLFNCRERRLI